LQIVAEMSVNKTRANLRTANCSIITSGHQDQLWLELKYSMIRVKLYINTSRPEMAVGRYLSQLCQYKTGRIVSQQSGYDILNSN